MRLEKNILNNAEHRSAEANSANPAISLAAPHDVKVPVGANESAGVSLAGGMFSIVIKARQYAWLSVMADGKRIMHATIEAPTETTVAAHRQIFIRPVISALSIFDLMVSDLQHRGTTAKPKL